MPNRLFELMEERNISVEAVANAIGKSADYIYRIRNPKYKERLNEDIMKPIADAIGCYPSELLPSSWQKPSSDLDIILLENSIKDADVLLKAANRKMDDAQKASLIKDLYEYYSEQKKEGQPPALSDKEKKLFLRLVK